MIHIKTQFPIFKYHPDLVYLDSAATTQKPKLVINGIKQFYEQENASIHRGVYQLASQTTIKYEATREKIAQFIGAASAKEIIYTTGTTAGINLVAQSFLKNRLQKGDEVIISAMEHHANLIPWQMVCQQQQAKLRVIPLLPDGSLDQSAFLNMLHERTKFLAIVHISNAFGTINPIEEMIQAAHQKNIPVLVDAAQSAAHYDINVQRWNSDFLVFSGHKLYGPTGIGVLHGKMEHLQEMLPLTYGGDMIRQVTFENTTFAAVPQRFEAGTTHIAGVIGLGYAIDFLQQFHLPTIQKHLKKLEQYASKQLVTIEGVRIIGTAKEKAAICSFVVDGVHPHDMATFLGAEQIAVRAGNHCTQPAMELMKVGATTRASFGIYNTFEDVDKMVGVVRETKSFFG